jgi:drug/metabolite transporter (DMT)-like permease
MDLDIAAVFSNVTPLTVTLIMLSGISAGIYFAALTKYRQNPEPFSTIVTAVVMGLSFYLPLFAATLAEGRPNAERLIGSMCLWVLFALTTAASSAVTTRFVHDRRK